MSIQVVGIVRTHKLKMGRQGLIPHERWLVSYVRLYILI
jgi:hypothetical protein